MEREFLDSPLGHLSATPILDGLEPPPEPKYVPLKPWKRRALVVVLSLAVGAGLAALPGTYEFSIVAYLVFLQIAVAVHEAGHVVAGLVTGFLFRGVTVGGFTVINTVKGWRASFNWKTVVGGGRAYMIPVKGPLDDWRYGVVYAGGPLASFLLFAALWFSQWPASNEVRHGALLASGMIAALFFWPHVGIAVTDISLLIMLARKDADWRRMKMLQSAQTWNLQCVRPRDWDPRTLREAVAIEGGNARILLHACAFQIVCAADREDAAECGQAIETTLRASGRMPSGVRALVYLLAAEHHALRRSDAALARAWFERARAVKGVPAASLACVEAAVLYAEGRFRDVPPRAYAALAQLRNKTLGTAMVEVAVERLEGLIAKSAAAL